MMMRFLGGFFNEITVSGTFLLSLTTENEILLLDPDLIGLGEKTQHKWSQQCHVCISDLHRISGLIPGKLHSSLLEATTGKDS